MSVFNKYRVKKWKTIIQHYRNNSKIKIVERGNIDTPTYEYMAAHLHGLVQTLQ